MSNLLAAAGVAHDGRLFAPAGERAGRNDRPARRRRRAAAVLHDARSRRRTYALTGPEAVTYAEVAARAVRRDRPRVEFVDVPDDAAQQAMVEAGLPDEVAEQVVAIFALSGVARWHVTSAVAT